MKHLCAQNGFTLIEVIVVTAIIIFFVSSGIPLYSRFFEKSQIDEAAEQISSLLKLSREMSIARNDNYSYGIFFNNSIKPHKYIYFKGNNYLSRDTNFDRLYLLGDDLFFEQIPSSGEIVFSKGLGEPSATTTIILQSDNDQKKVIISDFGQIYVEKDE